MVTRSMTIMYFPVLAALAGALFFGIRVHAHMSLNYPPPFNATNNIYRLTAADPYLEYPYDCCGPNDRWQYPCRGYQTLLGTPQGAPTATWEAGSSANWNISGIGNHFGGSCQVGFSTDGGDTFRVATSYEGNCPHRNSGNGPSGQNFEFTVPSDLAAGVQIFAWIWYNREQEMNMNCAAVNIIAPSTSASAIPTPTLSAYAPSLSSFTDVAAGSSTILPLASATPSNIFMTANGCSCTCESPINISSCSCTHCPSHPKSVRHLHGHADAHDAYRHLPVKVDQSTPSPHTGGPSFVAWSERPLMFVADDGNGCWTPHTIAELKFPDPGLDVVLGDGIYPLALPTGDCSQAQILAKQAYNGNMWNDGN